MPKKPKLQGAGHLRNLMRLLKSDSRTYEVEPELLATAKLYSEFFLDRYSKGRGKHWNKKEERNTYVGLIGQKAFDIICTQLNIPKDSNDPVVDWSAQKPYDFKIPQLGTVEVKCFDHYCKKVLIKVSEWHGNDFLVVFRLADEKPTKLFLEGWLTRNQVESLPISRKGEKYTPYADAYITDFQKLNPSSKFLKLLLKAVE